MSAANDIVEDEFDFEAEDAEYEDGNAQLGVAEEDQGIDQSNVIQGDNLRHAKPQTSNGYNEGPSEDDLPQEAL
ncbi:hypothetical protein MYU51_007067 [Penicillium brevicompactum]|uniref:Uncharacterized protein n=1 Tax=Penicillium brevicompactum TaxID=5074 RepID=A0A9W9QAR3_PENBR|nr:uncharacterized protein N7506_002068 [Penicillium brevicompactum]KAJ5329514.1 hypothetical protein N7452_009904 [Penicillium brevicompactum]KAJ5348815.1 hypothetical protein N7506_002068 [Penicillium brevicompactum]